MLSFEHEAVKVTQKVLQNLTISIIRLTITISQRLKMPQSQSKAYKKDI